VLTTRKLVAQGSLKTPFEALICLISKHATEVIRLNDTLATCKSCVLPVFQLKARDVGDLVSHQRESYFAETPTCILIFSKPLLPYA
jgi:hypothetical protein